MKKIILLFVLSFGYFLSIDSLSADDKKVFAPSSPEEKVLAAEHGCEVYSFQTNFNGAYEHGVTDDFLANNKPKKSDSACVDTFANTINSEARDLLAQVKANLELIEGDDNSDDVLAYTLISKFTNSFHCSQWITDTSNAVKYDSAGNLIRDAGSSLKAKDEAGNEYEYLGFGGYTKTAPDGTVTHYDYQTRNQDNSYDKDQIATLYSVFFGFPNIQNQHPNTCVAGTGYLDKKCNLLNKSEVDQLMSECGSDYSNNLVHNFSWAANIGCPISLVFDESAVSDEKLGYVNFPIDLSAAGKDKFYIWKASEKMPLLVYDPNHTGKITSASQLFGEWTFGGQKVASLIGMSTKKWSNGFEALASLDVNGDKVVSGKELESLALWFDKNQNGVSEEGEVVDVKNAGIKSLSVKYDAEDPVKAELVSHNGFSREVDGKEVSGKMIDWYSPKFNSEEEARSVFENSKTFSVESNSDYSAVNISSDKIAGVWKWKFNDRNIASKNVSNGLFAIREGKNGAFAGMTISEHGTKTPADKSSSLLQMYSFLGSKSHTSDNVVKLNFRLLASNDSDVVSEATLSSDGKRLSGVTRVIKMLADKKYRQEFQYKWDAEKVK